MQRARRQPVRAAYDWVLLHSAATAGGALPQNRRAERAQPRTFPLGRQNGAGRQRPAIIFKVR